MKQSWARGLLLAALCWSSASAADVLRCPPAGTQTTFPNGTVVTYSAPIPSALDLCPWSNRLRSGVATYDAFGSNPAGRALGQAMAKVYAGGVGSKTTLRTGSSFSAEWDNVFTFEAIEDLKLGEQTRRAARISIEQSGIMPNRYRDRTIYWFDIQTNVLVRRRHEVLSGNPPSVGMAKPLDVSAVTAPR